MRRKHKKNGYSLIEVVLATAIFGVVLMVGTSSFASVNRVAREARIYQDLAQTGVFISETLATSIRNAYGEKDSSGQFKDTGMPFTISNPGTSCTTINIRSSNPAVSIAGTSLEIRGAKNREFTSVANPEDGFNFTLKENDTIPVSEAESMLPNNVVLDSEACFYGVHYANNLKIQPFVIFEFTLRHLDSGLTKTFRSASAGREYF